MKHRHHTQKRASGGNIREAEMSAAKSKSDSFKHGGKKLKSGGHAMGMSKSRLDRHGRKHRASGGALSSAASTSKRKDSSAGAGHESVTVSGDGEEDDGAGYKSGGKLTASARNKIAGKNFALPGRRYPIEDTSHARNALARVAQHGTPEEKARVRRKVHEKYPSIG